MYLFFLWLLLFDRGDEGGYVGRGFKVSWGEGGFLALSTMHAFFVDLLSDLGPIQRGELYCRRLE